MVAIESGKNVDNGYIDIDVSKMSTNEARKVKFNVDLDKYKNKVEENDVAIEGGGDPKKLSRREARKYHDDWRIDYITLGGTKGVLTVKRTPDKSKCALYSEKREKLSEDFDTMRPLYNEKGEWIRLFLAHDYGNGYCLVNEWGHEVSGYYKDISNIDYKPVGGDLSKLSKGNGIGIAGWNLTFVGEKPDGSKVFVEYGQEKELPKK